MTKIRTYLAAMVDIRKGEALLTLLMFSYYYVVLVTYYLLKPARDSLFLVKLGASQLPLVFIITALIIAPITTMYSAASRRLRLTHLIYITSAILIVNLAALRWLLTVESGWVFYLFYVWVSIYGALAASQYWLFANAVYTPSQGKRLFALLNLGGILGAMTGGEVTGFFVKTLHVKTEDLLFFCMAFIALFAAFAKWAWAIYSRDAQTVPARRRTAGNKGQGESVVQMFRMIKSSRHLTYLVGIIALTMAVASFVDFQFKTVSVEAFPDKEGLTSFLGVFYGRLSLVSLALQLFFAYRLVRLVGVAGVVLFLPLGLLAGSGLMLVMPGLLAATLTRGAQGALTYSIDKTGRELLFLPVPLEVKKRTKVFIDMFVDRWFRGLAGAALLLFTAVLGFGVRQLTVVVVVLLAAWIVLVLLIRREYVNAFRLALARRELDPEQLSVNIADTATLGMLRDLLRSDKEREIVYAQGLLADVRDTTFTGDMERLLSHPSDEVKRRALCYLDAVGAEVDESLVAPLVADSDSEVRLAAMHFVTVHGGDAEGRLRGYMAADDRRVAATALRCAAGGEGLGFRHAVERERVRELIAGDGADRDEVRIEVARALGELADGGMTAELRALAGDGVAAVAGEAVLAMGATRGREFVPTLVEMLGDSSRRKYARAALVEYGNGVVGTLGDYLGDESTDVSVRRNVPAVLSRIATQQSADELSASLISLDASIRFRVVKALNKLRRDYPDLVIAQSRVEEAFVDETRMYYEILQVAMVCRGRDDTPAGALLTRALNERLGHNLERIFRVLGLYYPPTDIYSAYLGIVSSDRDRQASAVEFVDNLLGKGLKKYLFPIIDRVSEAVTIQRGRDLFGYDIDNREKAMVALVEGRDPWLRACAIFCCVGDCSGDVRIAVERARRDPDPLVRETAELALRQAP